PRRGAAQTGPRRHQLGRLLVPDRSELQVVEKRLPHPRNPDHLQGPHHGHLEDVGRHHPRGPVPAGEAEAGRREIMSRAGSPVLEPSATPVTPPDRSGAPGADPTAHPQRTHDAHAESDAESGKAPPPARPQGVSVIIVSYNVRELLDACLQSLQVAAAHLERTQGARTEVIVFDNDSRDGTVTLLKPRWPQVTWVASDRNLGFGSGCNRGAALATQDLLLFLNPDTLVREDTLAVMLDF